MGMVIIHRWIPQVNTLNMKKGCIMGINFGNIITKAVEAKAVYTGVTNIIDNLRSGNVIGAITGASTKQTGSATLTGVGDWRVRLSRPMGYESFFKSSILTPLNRTDGNMIWPLTPTISLTHSANYNQTNPTHSIYGQPSYQYSTVDSFTVAGTFIVETSDDADYWIAAKHFLEVATKMAFGDTSNAGSPPPVLRLNGYGKHIFNNVPVIVLSSTVELPDDVSYIQSKTDPVTYVPSRSTISANLQVMYSRSSTSNFSYDKLVNGDYLKDGSGFL